MDQSWSQYLADALLLIGPSVASDHCVGSLWALRQQVQLLAEGHSRHVNTSLEELECLPSTLTTAQTPSPTNKQTRWVGGQGGAGDRRLGVQLQCLVRGAPQPRARATSVCLLACLCLHKHEARLFKYLRVQLEACTCLWSTAVSQHLHRRPLLRALILQVSTGLLLLLLLGFFALDKCC